MLFMVNDNSLQPLQSGDVIDVEDKNDKDACGMYENNGSVIIDECEKKNGWFIGAIVGKFSRLREKRGEKDDTICSQKVNET